jgi:hypothetical protein
MHNHSKHNISCDWIKNNFDYEIKSILQTFENADILARKTNKQY